MSALQSTTNSTASAHGVTIDARLLQGLHGGGGRHAMRIGAFALMYVATGLGAFLLATAPVAGPWTAFAALPLYLVAGASLHGISLFVHEGVHGTLSRSPGWNRAISIACAAPVLQNFAAYRVLHLNHHQHLGGPGDPDHYDNYSSWTWLVFTAHWLRLLIGYPVYIVMIPILGWRQAGPTERRWILLETALVLLLIVAAVAFAPGEMLLHTWLVPMLFINTMVNIRGMSQHTFLEEPDDVVRGTRSILTNPVTAFFMCNENYHLEHHLFPGVPWYNLDRLHLELKEQLVARRAPFISSYFAFVCEFVAKSVARSPWGRRRRVA